MTASEKKEFIKQYEHIHTSLMRFCIVKSRGLMDPKDLAHDVLLIGLENYQNLKNKNALLPYLFTTANRICINKIRRKKFIGHYEEDNASQIVDEVNNVDKGADISILYAAMEQLPPLQKEALILFEISDLPIKEIMVIQESGESTVKQRIKRGRDKLAELLQEKKKKSIAVLTTVLFSSNTFSMTNLDSLFQTIKELPHPISHNEAISTIQNFKTLGTATNSSANQLGTSVIKKTIIGSFIAGAIITTSVILANPSNTSNEEWATTNAPAITKLDNPNKQKQLVTENPEYITEHLIYTTDKIESTQIDTTHTKSDSSISIPFTLTEASILTLDDSSENITSQTLTSGNNTYSTEHINVVTINNIGDRVELKTWSKNQVKIIPNHSLELKDSTQKELILQRLAFSVKQVDNELIFWSPICGIKEMHYGFGIRKNTVTLDTGEKIKYKKLELNYVIMIPENMNISISGSYDKLTIPHLANNLTLQLNNTKLTLGDVNGEADIKLNYSRADLGNFNSIDLKLYETKANLKNIESLNLSARYSEINTGDISLKSLSLYESELYGKSIRNDLNGTMKYSKLIIDQNGINKSNLTLSESTVSIPQINELKGSARYSKVICNSINFLNIESTFESKFFIGQISKLDITSSKYTDYQIKEISTYAKMTSFEDELTIEKAGLAELTFQGRYTNYNITLSKPANYTFSYLASYTNLDYTNLNLTVSPSEQQESNNHIKGFFDNGNSIGSGSLIFDCFEGNVKLK